MSDSTKSKGQLIEELQALRAQRNEKGMVQAREALRLNETRFRAITENTTDLTMIVDRDGNYQYVSPSCEQTVGYRPDEMLRKNRELFVHPEDLATVNRVLLHATREPGKTFHVEHYRARHRDGNWVHLEALVTGMLDVEGVHGIVVNSRDISLRVRGEQQLAEYRDHLEVLVEQRTRELAESREQLRVSERLASVGTLAAGMAHEINNPIGTILLAAQNVLELRRKPHTEKLVDDCLRGIVADAERCSRIIRNVMDFARRQPSRKEIIGAATVIERAIALTDKFVRDHDSKLKLDIAPHLPCVRANPIEIEQVLVELITNAVEARSASPQIRIEADQTVHGVRISVHDNGRGISGGHVNRVFDPFFTTRREQAHAGLGLSVVHGIIQQHSGRIEVKSRPGQGTTFTIHLPVASGRPSEVADGKDSDH
jgi:PAS domain S-box-containing protein